LRECVIGATTLSAIEAQQVVAAPAISDDEFLSLSAGLTEKFQGFSMAVGNFFADAITCPECSFVLLFQSGRQRTGALDWSKNFIQCVNCRHLFEPSEIITLSLVVDDIEVWRK